jgi:hypothetical protein
MLRFKTIETQGIKFFINLNAPVHLAPELQALFTRSRKRSPSVTSIGEDEDQDEHQRKQPRLIGQAAAEEQEDEEEYDIALGSGEVMFILSARI